MKNIFYFRYINAIGGIETFFYYLAKKYQDWDITIYYLDGDSMQINRLKQYVRVKKYEGEIIKCDKAFFNYNLDIIENVEAKEYYQIAHGCYKKLGIKANVNKKITKYLGVSNVACQDFKELTGFNTELVYNPIEIDKPKKVLNLISATRLSSEKGKSRMIKLGKILDEAEIPYLWTIFTNDTNAINNPNIIYMKPKLDIINYIANADYLVQLSDNEAYCYSVVESLSVGTPVIVTDVPVFKEIGVNKDNGFILDFDLSNVPIEEIYKGLPKFEYKPKEDNWITFLMPGKSTYKEELKMKVKVKCVQNYYDLQLSQNVTVQDEPFIVNLVRANELVDAKVCEIVEEVVEEPTESTEPTEPVVTEPTEPVVTEPTESTEPTEPVVEEKPKKNKNTNKK